MAEPRDKIAVRLLRRLAGWIYDYPRAFFYPQIILFLICILFTVRYLQFDTSRNNLVGGDKKYHQNFLQFKKEFPAQDDLVVVVESENAEKNRQFVERLGARLEAETNLFTDVFYKGDLKMLGPKALLFVPEQDLRDMQKQLQDYRPFIQQFTRATNLVSLFSLINKQFSSASLQTNSSNESLISALPALTRILEQAHDSVTRPGIPPSPGINALFGAGREAEQQMYITFAQGRIYLVTTRALREDLNGAAVERIRQLIVRTQFEVPGVNVGFTGEPVLEFDEMVQSTEDSTKASIIALLLCAFIFIYAYRQTGRPLKATFCLIVGVGYTMGFTTLAVGHLNILTISFVPILIGLAIDFGVHLITRYEEEIRHGRPPRIAMEKAVVNTGTGIFTGAFTTAAAFFAMGATDFKGIQEMGIICGGGMLVCLVPMMTLLPVLLLRGRQNVIDQKQGETDRRTRIESVWLSRPRAVLLVVTVISITSFFYARRVHFDYNLLNMQSKGLPAVVYSKRLIETADKSVLFGAIITDNLEEAVALEKKVRALPSVKTVNFGGMDPMSEALTEIQDAKLKIVSEIKQDLASIQFSPMDLTPVDRPELSQVLFSFEGYLGLAAGFVPKEEKQIADRLQALRQAAFAFRKAMLEEDRDVAVRLLHFQTAFFTDIRETFQALQQQDASSRLTIDDLPTSLRSRFVGTTGKFLLQVYPKEDVWDRKHQEVFVKELRSVDSNVTGTPVQLLEYTTLLKTSYEKAAQYSLAAIVVLVLLHFRSLVCLVLALLPVLLGTLLMLGFMGLFGFPFNPANIMTLPLVVGIGVTNGIHIINRFAEEENPGILGKSTGKAVLVSGLTTIAGFGSLLIAEHQGISSLGFIMSIGVTTCMVVGLTLLPAMLTLLIRAGWKVKRPSDGKTPSLGLEEPR